MFVAAVQHAVLLLKVACLPDNALQKLHLPELASSYTYVCWHTFLTFPANYNKNEGINGASRCGSAKCQKQCCRNLESQYTFGERQGHSITTQQYTRYSRRSESSTGTTRLPCCSMRRDTAGARLSKFAASLVQRNSSKLETAGAIV